MQNLMSCVWIVHVCFYHNLPPHTHTHNKLIFASNAGPAPTPAPSVSSACTCTCPTSAVTVLPTSLPGKTILQCYKAFTFAFCHVECSVSLWSQSSALYWCFYCCWYNLLHYIYHGLTICISCVFKTRSKTTSPHPSTSNAPYEMVGMNQKIDVIPLDAYGTVK